MKHQLSTLSDVCELFERSGFEYWLFGGWAVDFHVGAVTRDHDDVDLAVWRHDAAAIGSLLATHGWEHRPHADEDGGTGYEREAVRVELTYLLTDDEGRVSIPLRERHVVWSEEPLGNEKRELLGVRIRVIPLALLRSGKSEPREDRADAAKDRADFDALSRL